MLRYALYARKSHDDTKLTEKSLLDQLSCCRSLAGERGYTVVREYQESKSAKDAGVRPLYAEMIKRIKKGEIDAILTWHVNRLARNMDEGGTLADLLIRGVLKEIRTPHEVFRSGDNILPLVLQQATATQNNLDHALAVRRGMTSRREEGGWTHRAPAGYLNRRDPLHPKRGVLERDPERFDLLKQAWQMLLTGAYSVPQVIETLNDDWGFRTRPTAARGGDKMARSHGYKLFSNLFYAGYVMQDGQIRKGLHEPMVTVAEFNRAQQIIASHSKPRSHKREFAFSGLLRCGFCGQQVTMGQLSKNGKSRVYYRCSDTYGRCTKRGISEERLQEQIIQLLESITLDPELCRIALENIVRWLGERSGDTEKVYTQLHRSAEGVENQLSNLLSLRLREVVTDDALYMEKEAQLVAERNQLRLAIGEAEQEMEHIRSTALNGYSYAAFARDHFLVADANTKRELSRALGVEYVLRANEVSITLDPLLVEMAKFAQDISLMFEPAQSGSPSCYRVSFGTSRSFGRAEGTLFEPSSLEIPCIQPPPALIAALKSSLFSRFAFAIDLQRAPRRIAA